MLWSAYADQKIPQPINALHAYKFGNSTLPLHTANGHSVYRWHPYSPATVTMAQLENATLPSSRSPM